MELDSPRLLLEHLGCFILLAEPNAALVDLKVTALCVSGGVRLGVSGQKYRSKSSVVKLCSSWGGSLHIPATLAA
jgi:hypothetical protein